MKKIYNRPVSKVFVINTCSLLAGSGDGPAYTSTKGDNTQSVLSKDIFGDDWDD